MLLYLFIMQQVDKEAALLLSELCITEMFGSESGLEMRGTVLPDKLVFFLLFCS